MSNLGLPYIGSFQYTYRYQTENPLEEMWSRIARYGTTDFLKAHKPTTPNIDWNKYIDYIAVRIKQSVEFRISSKKTSLITSPLVLYYSFLNLTRAFMALGPEIIPSPTHGLTFKKSSDILSSSAKLTKGTFTDYLTAFGFSWKKDTIVSLQDAFARIIEINHDLRTIKNQFSYIIPVHIKALIRGPLFIHILSPYLEFPDSWKSEFPKLSEKCKLGSDKKSLTITDNKICESYDSISKYLNDNLYPNLTFIGSAYWYLIREVDKSLVFPRAAYYYIAMFILGNIVRYEPELLLEVSQMNSELGWFAQRFIDIAERFYPQLKLWEQSATTIYF